MPPHNHSPLATNGLFGVIRAAVGQNANRIIRAAVGQNANRIKKEELCWEGRVETEKESKKTGGREECLAVKSSGKKCGRQWI